MDAVLSFLEPVLSIDLLQRYGPRILEGLVVTLELVVVSIAIGFLLGLFVALMRISRNAFFRSFALSYVTFFRGTPLLAQVFLIYYGAGQFREALEAVGLWVLFKDAWFCAFFSFTLNTTAYQAEIFRGGIQALPKGQTEAALALGLGRWQTFFKIVLPQVLMISLRPLGNEVVLMVKASAISSLVTVYDLMGVTRLAFARTYDFQIYLWAAVLYLVLVEIIRRVWSLLEARLTRHLRAGRSAQLVDKSVDETKLATAH